MGLISQSIKDQLGSVLQQVAETFERPILVYKDPERVIISSSPDYNRFQANYQNILSQNPTNVPQVFTIQARIKYENKQGIMYTNGATQEGLLKLIESDGRVRIKVNESGRSIIGDAKKIEFDGFQFKIDSSIRPHGLFDNQYYTYILQRET